MIWLFATLGACPKAPPTAAVDWAALPQLPSPTAGTYARVPARPPDPGVAQVVAGRDHDASLGGTAAGLALSLVSEQGTMTPQEVREAAWRAGWPYPIRSVHSVWTTAEAPPPPAVGELLDGVPEGAWVGLVRARASLREVWVLVTSQPRADLGPIPRQLAVGMDVKLPALGPGVEFTVADPLGTVMQGNLELAWSTPANVDGEWLIELRDARGRLALFPIYVGLLPPELSLLPAGKPPANATAADQRARSLFVEVRDAYGLGAPQDDPLLQNAVLWAMSDPPPPADRIATRVGVEPGDLWRLECRAATVETCLDDLLWDPAVRPALLADSVWWGVGTRVGSQGVHLVIILARS